MDAIAFTRLVAPELGASSASKSGPASDAGEGEFADLLRQGMDRLNELEKNADAQVNKLLSGEPVELHRVVLAGEQASLAFDLMMSVRNKVVDAYQEVMRMQV
ncbi:MAG: flagellar hook-basal body complex protein FliE [Acidobacteria bacterium]|nr:flagellar hook-basal body complex protein FliE [Acidobacteriota bacterium]